MIAVMMRRPRWMRYTNDQCGSSANCVETSGDAIAPRPELKAVQYTKGPMPEGSWIAGYSNIP